MPDRDTTTRAVRFHRCGDASVLQIEEIAMPQPGLGEVRIRVSAIGLNRAEVMFRNGAYLEQPEFPSRLGYEAVGIVDGVGPGVNEFEVGERVNTIPAFSMTKYGVYGEYVIVPAHAIARVPVSISDEQAVSLWMQYITAYGALIDVAALEAGQWVLVTAASSSVGIASIQVAKHAGARVIATSRGEGKLAMLKKIGADVVVSTQAPNWKEQIHQLTDHQGVQVIFDPVGGPLLSDLAEVAADGAMIIEYGALDERETPFPLFTALAKGLVVRGYTLFEVTKHADRLASAKQFLMPLFEKGEFTPLVDKVFDLGDIQDAHQYMESNRQIGKIVVTVG